MVVSCKSKGSGSGVSSTTGWAYNDPDNGGFEGRIVVKGNTGNLYVKKETSFGAIYYFKDGATITEAEFIKNTEGVK